jgi:hypothetical protein
VLAATANVYGVPLLTRDTADFQIISDLIDARDPSVLQPPESGSVGETECDEEQEEAADD